jgi:putative ABC transport system permease protein
MSALLQDVRFAARLLARQPLLTAVVVVTLGFGIGANTAIFSFVNALLLRPYAFPELDALVTLWERHPQQGGRASVRPSDAGHPIAPADFLDLRRRSRSFEGLAALRQRDFTLIGQGEPERLMGALVSPEFFTLLRADAQLGRTLRPEEAEAGRDGVVVVSHGLWQRRLGGAPDVLGRTLVLSSRPYTLVGVMPPAFAYPTGGVELWTPLAFSQKEETERSALSLRALGRLAPGTTLEQARAELAGIALALAREHPRTNDGRSFAAVRLREQQAGLTRPFMALFQAAALLVLLIACANVSGVLLARALSRQRELALRAALGASRWRVARQMLVESLALSLLGTALALVVAGAGVRAIRAAVPPDITKWVAGWSEIRLDERALAVALLAALASALATAVLPALGATRPGLVAVLREGGRGAGGGRRGWRGPIVLGQMALALVLVASASLMLRGTAGLLERYQGLDPSGVLTFRLRLPDSRYPAGRPVSGFYSRLLDELAGVPGVESAAAVAHLPGDLGPVPGGAVSVRGRSAPGDLDLPVADHQAASPEYFRSLRILPVAGRLFGPQDGTDSPPVAVVSESMARRLWPGVSALGQQLKQGKPDDPAPWREVVGVVEDVTQYWFDAEPRSTLYLPYDQAPRASMFVLVRGRGDVAALGPLLRSRVAALDPELPVDELRTLRGVVDDGMAFLHLAASLLVILGGVALGLSALGVYGIVAQDVVQRTQEIGVRLALGAAPGQVLRLMLRRALRLAALALVVGVPACLAASRLMAGALFGIVRPGPFDLVLYSGGLLALAVVAAWAPARRAAALDPLSALRSG